MYHQKKDFISEPCEPKDSEYLKKFKLLIQIEFVEVSVIIRSVYKELHADRETGS